MAGPAVSSSRCNDLTDIIRAAAYISLASSKDPYEDTLIVSGPGYPRGYWSDPRSEGISAAFEVTGFVVTLCSISVFCSHSWFEAWCNPYTLTSTNFVSISEATLTAHSICLEDSRCQCPFGHLPRVPTTSCLGQTRGPSAAPACLVTLIVQPSEGTSITGCENKPK